MIRTPRPTRPSALNSPQVQQFVKQHAAYKANPATAPKPKRPKGYRTSSLLEAFDTYFYAKCYLTERKFASAWAMDVDHLEPVSRNPGRVLDWDNLYPAEHVANIMRGDQFPAGGLLDPCVDDVEHELIYTLVEQGERPGFRAFDPTNIKAVNTASLLNELHSGKAGNADSVKSTRELRFLIEKKYKQVLEAWSEYNLQMRVGDEYTQADAEAKLRVLLSRETSFTMLMRSIPAIRKHVSDLFD